MEAPRCEAGEQEQRLGSRATAEVTGEEGQDCVGHYRDLKRNRVQWESFRRGNKRPSSRVGT